MPKASATTNLNFSPRKPQADKLKLAKLGDTVTLRFADYPNYYGQHWLEDERKFVPCPRVNSADPANPDYCGYCEDYARGDKEKKPKINFVFPALDRKTGKPVIFEITQSVWAEIQSQEKKGIKIFEYDWYIERTENKPKYYEVTRLEKDPLDQQQAAAYAEAKKIDIEDYVNFRLNGKKEAAPSVSQDDTLNAEFLAKIDEEIPAPGDNDLPF